jgi:hypothetical protein
MQGIIQSFRDQPSIGQPVQFWALNEA